MLYANMSIDFRGMQLGNAYEGYMLETFKTPLIDGQGSYDWQSAGMVGRPKRISIRYPDSGGGGEYIVPLVRDERWLKSTHTGTSSSVRGSAPTFRLRGSAVLLEPTPNGVSGEELEIEFDNLPTRLVADGDTLDELFPDVMETLLIYDAAIRALSVEGTQGNTAEWDTLIGDRAQYEAEWKKWIEFRSSSRVFSRRFSRGD